jgi:hypothetical protein
MNDLRSGARAALQAAQNADGGWGYRQGSGSWTEPTALALLALQDQMSGGAWGRGAEYLLTLQRPDGGWPPQAGVDRSTWVTALALLALGSRLSPQGAAASVGWIEAQRGADSGRVYRLRRWMLGLAAGAGDGEGWPWYPETAAWVMPTALTILALDRQRGRGFGDGPARRVAAARTFLWSRMCKDGGWNHGSSRALGYEADSYPETTGVALAALRGDRSPKLKDAIGAAERHLAASRSSSATSWLRIGLAAHGRRPALPGAEQPVRDNVDRALFLLAEQTVAGNSPRFE